jgi:hypothetical protein
MNLEFFGEAERREVLSLFRPESLVEIEKAMKLSNPHEELRSELSLLAWKYWRNRKQRQDSPASKQANIRDYLLRLRELLSRAEAGEAFELLQLVGAAAWGLAGDLDVRREALDRAIAAASPATNRLPDFDRHALATALRQIELRLTGGPSVYTYDPEVDSYSGALFLMMQACEAAVAYAQGIDPPSSEAIAKFLSRRQQQPTEP